MVLAFPKFDVDLLIWVVLVPLFWVATGAGAKRGAMLGAIAGLTLVIGGFSWVHYAMQSFTGLGALAMLLFLPWALFEAVPWTLLGLFLGSLRGRDGSAAPERPSTGRPLTERPLTERLWSVIPFWVAVEHFFPHIFPWHLGGALYDRTRLVQCVDLLGVSGLSALVLLVNVTVLHAARATRSARRGLGAWPVRSAILSASLLVAALSYGTWRLAALTRLLAGTQELKVALIQPVVSPELKQSQNQGFFDSMVARSRALVEREKPDLLLWPEGTDARGYPFDAEDRFLPQSAPRDSLGFQGISVPLVCGGWSQRLGPDGKGVGNGRNTAAYVLPGRWPPEGFYHKNIPVPFGESVPLLDSLPRAIRDLLPNVGNLELGTTCPRFFLDHAAQRLPFRILICYEAVLPSFVRATNDDCAFLVNLTEDIWYGPTSHVGQHVSVLRLRAVECRTTILRSANAGPSGVVDPSGSFSPRTTPFRSEDATFSFRPVEISTVYESWGHAFPGVCLVWTAVGLLLRWRRSCSSSRSKMGAARVVGG